jgi:anti-sigma factor RsiW
MSDGRAHPPSLLWYVSGEIAAADRAEVESHLESCEGCRIEARSLASMMKSLKSQSRVDHVSARDLVAYADGGTGSGGAAIESHLSECGACREDLQALERAEAVERRPAPIRRVSRRGWALASIAAAAVVAGLLLPIARAPAPRPEAAGVQHVVFPAQRRGPQERVILRGPGPWTARVVLPFGSEDGRIEVSIHRDGGALIPGTTAIAPAHDEILEVPLPSLPDPGRYELWMRPELAASEPQVRRFEVVIGDGGKGAS